MAREPGLTEGTAKVADTEKDIAEHNAQAAAESQANTDQQSVDLIATGSFHEQDGFQGRLLQVGDTFSAPRSRAVQLRANGLVTYADKKAEDEAAKSDHPPSTDQGKPVITTRSMRGGRNS